MEVHMRKLNVAGLAFMLLSMVGFVDAGTYTVNPTLSGRTCEGEAGLYDGYTVVGVWYGSVEYTTWLKYSIPEYAGEQITQILLNVDITTQYNPPYTAGVSVYYVPDDSWTTSTVTSTWTVDGASVVYNRSSSDSGVNGTGLITSDITSYLTKSGEGEGTTLSICLTRTGGGYRGASMSVPTLTIITEKNLVVRPVLQGSISSATGAAFSSTMITGLWSSTGSSENVSYVKFVLPESVDRIRSLVLKGTNSAQYNPPYYGGVVAYLVPNDSWDAGTIAYDWACDSNHSAVLYNATNSGGTLPAVFGADLTSWLSISGEGAGQTLSLKLIRFGGGTRGSLLENLYLEVGYLDRGHEILIDKGLQIQAQVFPAVSGGLDMTRWAASNFTTVNLQWGDGETIVPSLMGDAPGMAWGRWGTGIGPYEAELDYMSNMVSFQFYDEVDIGSNQYASWAVSSFASWHNSYPEVICFTNQYGDANTEEDMDYYKGLAWPDMLMFDYYPFDGHVLGGSPTDLYRVMQKYRLWALEGNDGTGTVPIPYGLYTQTYAVSGHEPTDSEMRLNQFAAWAFGYKFVSAFVYDHPGEGLGVTPTLFNGTGTSSPTTAFYQMAETNRQSRNLGPALVRLLSTDLRVIMGRHGGGTVNSVPAGITPNISNADTYLTGVSATNTSGMNGNHPGDVIIGFFKVLRESDDGETYSNEKYFMVVNGLSDGNATAAQTQQTIRLTFNFGSSSINSLQRLSRTTGTVELVPLVSEGNGVYHLDLTLDGGTGDLFKYNTGAPFVGVQAAAVPVLAVSPETQTVPKEAGTANITVSNNGAGTLAWTAQVTSGSDWLSITSGVSGTNSGTIVVSFTKNAVPDTSRTATIQIAAADATGSPCTVTVVQLAPALIPGDANKDGSVDVGDLGILAANYGGSNKSWGQGDFNGDKLVDVGDLGILAAHYGQGTTNLAEADFSTDYAKAFGTTVDDADIDETSSSLCSSLGLPLLAGLALMGLMLVKLKE
jgi:hypothetical protein